jgi:hypothetical protein
MSDTIMDSFYFTKTGIIIPTVTGVISFLSSMIIISIVLRSMNGIKTTYHRIILGMSCADCLTSFAIALTTIPMPKDVIYPFQMPSYGNVATCEAQGLIYMTANAISFSMNGILNIYYLCTLRYNMSEKTFRCYLEIPLYIVTLLISTIPAVTLMEQDLLNPNPTDPYCVINTYPLNCTNADNPECRGGGGGGASNAMYIFTILLGFVTLMITMALVVHSFYRNKQKLRKAVESNEFKEDDGAYADLQYAQETFGIMTRQALLYIAAFFITWIFVFVHIVFTQYGNGAEKGLLPVLRMIFQPLQGFFNLIIFAYHKISMVLRSDEDLTFVEALDEVFLHPNTLQDTVQIHNLEMVFNVHHSNHPLVVRQNNDEEIGKSVDISDSGKASKAKSSDLIRSEHLASIGEEEKPKTYKYYGGQEFVHPFPDLQRKNKLLLSSPPADEIKGNIEDDLSIISNEPNDDGISFASKSIKTPVDLTEGPFIDDEDSTNFSYPDARPIFSKASGSFSDLSGFPRKTNND